VATVDIGGPFKVETTPHTIAAKVTVPEEVGPIATETKPARPTVWIAVAVAVVIVILAVGLAAKRK
jgi:carbohydrate-binding DOMON domain-containing protein